MKNDFKLNNSVLYRSDSGAIPGAINLMDPKISSALNWTIYYLITWYYVLAGRFNLDTEICELVPFCQTQSEQIL